MIKTQHCPNCEATEQKLHDFRQEVSDTVLEGDAQTILYLLGVRHGREDERAKIAAEASQPTQSDPEAMRYGFDGFGYKYIDSGSGSDWRTRHPDAEPLYAEQPTQSDVLREALERIKAATRNEVRAGDKGYVSRYGIHGIASAALQEQGK